MFLINLLLSCAQTGSLSGGPQDLTPPRLIKSDPDTFQTNFASSRIKLTFDEFIELENPRQNVLITPVLADAPLIQESGKNLLIKNIDDSLWPNTTYVIEFNEAIQDITEHNPALGFRYVFSTGNYVDSLSVRGFVHDAYTLDPVENAFIFMYETHDDSVPYLETPRYIGRTNKLGSFHVKNMKAGKYKAFFCTDENGNFKYDLETEKIDFLDHPIILKSDSTPGLEGYLFKEAKKDQFLKGYGTLNKWSWYVSYNLPFDSLSFEDISSHGFRQEEFSQYWAPEGDSIVFWARDSSFSLDSAILAVRVDSILKDTIELAFYDDDIAPLLKLKFDINGSRLDLGKDLVVRVKTPLIKVDTSGVVLLADSNVEKYSLESDPTRTKLTIQSNWKENQSYSLIIDSAALVDLNGQANDSTFQKFNTPKQTYYGTLDINIGVPEFSDGILILMDKGGKDLESKILKKSNKYYFPYLEPGEYRIKYISDSNGNGVWDPGNYLNGTHAESVKIYHGLITIRSNWDQVIEWKFK